MKTLKYKTNINCEGCLKSVTPFLNELDNVESWKVEIENPEKLLTVEIDNESDDNIINAVKQAGFEIVSTDN